jgi:hypothetical protein
MHTNLDQLQNRAFCDILHESQPRDSLTGYIVPRFAGWLKSIYGQTVAPFSTLLRSPVPYFTYLYVLNMIRSPKSHLAVDAGGFCTYVSLAEILRRFHAAEWKHELDVHFKPHELPAFNYTAF